MFSIVKFIYINGIPKISIKVFEIYFFEKYSCIESILYINEFYPHKHNYILNSFYKPFLNRTMLIIDHVCLVLYIYNTFQIEI